MVAYPQPHLKPWDGALKNYIDGQDQAVASGAVHPTDLAAVATSGQYSDLSGKPTLGTAAAQPATAFATATQGGKADTAVQIGGDLAGSNTSPQVTSGAHHTHTADQMVAGQFNGQRLPDGLAYVSGVTASQLTITWHQMTTDAYPGVYPAAYATPAPVWARTTATVARIS